MGTYIADAWYGERERLDALSRALDPTTTRLIDRLGLARGARCLEVGAGSGSIATWLSERVGEEGHVVALDLDTHRLASVAAAHPNLEVREGDVLTTDLREGSYDLVHARLVFGHLSDKTRALARLVGAARPGAWLLLEDADFLWTDVGMQPIYPEHYVEPYFRVWRAAVAYMKGRGFDGHLGRRLACFLKEAGLVDVGGEAIALIGNHDLTAAMRATVHRLGPALVDSQSISPRDLVAFDDLMSDTNTIFTGSPTFSVWGRRYSSECSEW